MHTGDLLIKELMELGQSRWLGANEKRVEIK